MEKLLELIALNTCSSVNISKLSVVLLLMMVLALRLGSAVICSAGVIVEDSVQNRFNKYTIALFNETVL
ncbi:MAG: hypothetical protein ACKPKO_02605 [Candidatus Fonsibacter sp.]